jgi:hypothetical protein
MSKNEEFVPFGSEWKKEMMKIDKNTLIDELLTPALKINLKYEEELDKLETVKISK